MKRFLPRIGLQEATLCFPWGEMEGTTLFLEWGLIRLEITFARRGA